MFWLFVFNHGRRWEFLSSILSARDWPKASLLSVRTLPQGSAPSLVLSTGVNPLYHLTSVSILFTPQRALSAEGLPSLPCPAAVKAPVCCSFSTGQSPLCRLLKLLGSLLPAVLHLGVCGFIRFQSLYIPGWHLGGKRFVPCAHSCLVFCLRVQDKSFKLEIIFLHSL